MRAKGRSQIHEGSQLVTMQRLQSHAHLLGDLGARQSLEVQKANYLLLAIGESLDGGHELLGLFLLGDQIVGGVGGWGRMGVDGLLLRETNQAGGGIVRFPPVGDEEVAGDSVEKRSGLAAQHCLVPAAQDDEAFLDEVGDLMRCDGVPAEEYRQAGRVLAAEVLQAASIHVAAAPG